MARHDKLIQRLLSRPKDFTYREVQRLLNGFGYMESPKGKTSGSRALFEQEGRKDILLHKPHPRPYLKQYAIKDLIDQLKEEGLV